MGKGSTLLLKNILLHLVHSYAQSVAMIIHSLFYSDTYTEKASLLSLLKREDNC